MISKSKQNLLLPSPHGEGPGVRPKMNGERPGVRTRLIEEGPGVKTKMNGEDPGARPKMNEEGPGVKTKMNGEDPGARPKMYGEDPGARPKMNGEGPGVRTRLIEEGPGVKTKMNGEKPRVKTELQRVRPGVRLTLFTLLILLSLSACTTSISFKDGIVEEEFVYEEAPFPSCHAATIAETPGGLVTAFFGGTHERNPDVCIWVSHKVDGGWTAPVEVANGIINDTLRYPTWNPVLFQVPEGDLLLFYKVGPHPSQWWGVMKRSSDGGKSWSEAEKLPDGYIGPVKNKPLLLEDGTLICPSSTEGNGWKIHFEYTKDLGKTWTRSEPINDGKIFNAIQPSILVHDDGKLQILARSRNRVLATSWSEDQGKSWSLVKASGLPNNNSGTDAVTLGDGRQLVVYNHVKTPANAPKGYRTPLNVALSDDGIHWEASLVLEDSEISQYSYPAVIQSADGMVHIVYTWRRERIKYVQIDPAKLKSRSIIDEKWPE